MDARLQDFLSRPLLNFDERPDPLIMGPQMRAWRLALNEATNFGVREDQARFRRRDTLEKYLKDDVDPDDTVFLLGRRRAAIYAMPLLSYNSGNGETMVLRVDADPPWSQTDDLSSTDADVGLIFYGLYEGKPRKSIDDILNGLKLNKKTRRLLNAHPMSIPRMRVNGQVVGAAIIKGLNPL